MASTYFTCNVGSPNQQRFTWSLWVKRSKLGVEQHLAGNYADNSNRTHLFITNTEKLYLYSELSGSNIIAYQTNRLFRDLNAWYHIVCAVDTTQAGGNRIRFYVNGEEENSFATETECNQNTNLSINGTHYIGTYGGNAGNSSYSFDGSISHLHFVDGSQLTPSSFGSTDSTTGEWKINTSPSVTYGSSGYFILKDGNSVTDQSGNSNNFTVAGGTLTKTEDNPSNVFCTLNPLQEPFASQTAEFSFGNTKVSGNDADWQRVYGTIGAKQGKWFYEFKNLQDDGYTSQCRIGWDSIDNINDGLDNYYSGLYIDRAGKLRGGIKGYNGYSPNAVQMTAAHSGGNFSFTANDILGMAIDLDNETFSVYKNGNLEINAYSYAGVSNNSLSKSRGFFIAPSYNWYSSSGNNNRSCFNFGNGYFETTAISSAGTNASGIGLFEYDVPANYTAWSTKGLNL